MRAGKPNNQLTPKRLLRLYQLGSLSVLILGLVIVAVVCSYHFAKIETKRADIFHHQIENLYGEHNGTFNQFYANENYDGIFTKIKQISEQLGNADFDLKLINEWGKCVFAKTSLNTSFPCVSSLSERKLSDLAATGQLTSPTLEYSMSTGEHQYVSPIYVQGSFKGMLFSSVSDPYGFHIGPDLKYTVALFSGCVGGVLLLWLAWMWFSKTFILSKYTKVLAELEKNEALSKLVAQLSHDIRSPLSALSVMVESAKNNLPPSQSQLVYLAVSRITGIADELLNRYKTPEAVEKNAFHLLSGIIHSIVSEKTVLLQGTSIRIEVDCPYEFRHLGIAVSRTKLQRCLSNLVNNSIEALTGKVGTIVIKVSSAPSSEVFPGNMVRLTVEDDGIGMDRVTLNKVRTIGGSFGKAEGSGLGVAFVRETVADAGGQFEMDSTINEGTCVSMLLPSSPTPNWLLTKLSVAKDDTIVILDDDETMHAFWKEKLPQAKRVHLRDPEEFNLDRYPPSSCTYLLDYEICASPVTGLNLIQMHGLGEKAVLVTSYYSDVEIQNKIVKLGAAMLPKFLASETLIQEEQGKKETNLLQETNNAKSLSDNIPPQIV